MSEEFFTVVFKGNIADFQTNPLHLKTEFGKVSAIRRGDAAKEWEISNA